MQGCIALVVRIFDSVPVIVLIILDSSPLSIGNNTQICGQLVEAGPDLE